MRYPNNRELTQLFISSFGEDPNFKLLESGIIVHFCYQEIEYNAYLKCISYAGKPYPLNVTRAQLPKRKEFKDIKKSAARFLFLGYDIINQVFVCWDPCKAKSRLNKKKYVSFFSRKKSQESVNLGEVRINKLSNGDAFAVFKKEDTGLFLQTIDSYFSFGETIVTDAPRAQEIIADKNHVEHNISAFDKTENDFEIEELIHQLWSSGSNRLEIIARCMNDYASRYPQMTFNSWKDFVYAHLDDHNQEEIASSENKQIVEANDKPSPHTYVISNDEENSFQSLHEAPASIVSNHTKVKDSRTVTYVIEDDNKHNESTKNVRALDLTSSAKKQPIANPKSKIDKFIDEFIRMRTATKKGIKSPHKAVLLITILKLIGLRVYKTNHIAFDDLLIIEFDRYWNKLVPKDFPFNKNICHPFIHLSTDSFFHLNLKRKLADLNANWDIKTIQDVCNYAYLDNSLFAIAQVEESRTKLINFLIDYFDLNNPYSTDSSSSFSRSESAVKQSGNEPVKRPSIKASVDVRRYSPESFSQYLSGVKNKHGRPFSKSSISVYVGATKGDYMKEVLLRFTNTDDLYRVSDLNILNRILDYLENVDFKGNSKTPLFALRLYIQFIDGLSSFQKSDDTTQLVEPDQLNQDNVIQYWLFSWDENCFLLHDYFRTHQYIDWNNKHNNRLNVGDIVFLYSSHPESTIRYVTRVTKINVPVSESIDDHDYSLTPRMPRTYKYCTRLKYIKKVRSPKLDFNNLRLNGLNCAIRSPLRTNRKLLNYILSVIGDID